MQIHFRFLVERVITVVQIKKKLVCLNLLKLRKENCSLDTVSIKRIGLLCVKKKLDEIPHCTENRNVMRQLSPFEIVNCA